tara:strand:- start:2924 stop:3442 length:519 start_codon:yes stop_codon:yes gene_type:complete
MSKPTNKTFTRILNSTLKSYQNVSDNLQALIVFALAHFANNGNACYVAQLLNAANEGGRVRKTDMRMIIKFIKAHSNVQITVDNNFTEYKVSKQKGKKATFTAPVDGVTWYNFDTEADKAAEFDLLKILGQLGKRLEKAENDPNIRVISKTASKKMLNKIKSELAALNDQAA